MKTLSILIPVFNNLKFTKQVIQSIQENIFFKDSYEIIILDNWSSDWTWDYLYDIKWDNIKVISLDENIFVNPAWNKLAKEAEWEFLFFLNNDITLFKNFDIKMIAVYEDKKIVCPLTTQFWTEQKFYQKANINWTCFMTKKSDYIEIPEQLKLWYWDDYLFRKRWVTWIKDSVIHWWSQTLNSLPDLQKIIDNDTEEWKEIIKKEWWIDERFK